MRALAALLLALVLDVTPAPAAEPVFVPGACPAVPAKLVPRLRCGTVRVPQDHARPDGPAFALAVVVIGSAQQPALPDPVVYLSGGPGSPLTRYAADQARMTLAPHRDLILVDQRGTGASQPAICPGQAHAAMSAALALAAGEPAGEAMHRQAVSACRGAAVAAGIDPAQFGTAVTVEDIEWVRRALGITVWNAYAVSYGTTVAMTLAATHPNTLRAVVLDSPYPPDPAPPWSTIVTGARRAFFAACAADPGCNGPYPDLAGTYRSTMEALGRSPRSLDLAYGPVPLTPSLLEVVVAELLYYPPAYPGLPKLLQALHEGNDAPLVAAVSALLPALEATDFGLHTAVECRDRPHYRTALPDGAAGLDRMQLYSVCDGWAPLGPPPVIPAGSAVPTLVLSGQFDPVSGPGLSRRVASTIGASARFVEFPWLGHHVRGSSACADRLVAAFIGEPHATLDTGCAADAVPPRFDPPAAR